ncbi:MAG: hypothetical protein CMA12_03325 [Euryarchaeota archaeon]|nr:hypothetical protein [Euryarchaeota archaeon]OUW22523.1 MAG: hypothetical protein CBD33_01670 [Euryarchaeota archaeon TMED173]|tara:strand:- start:776 stop:1444 length:669 start_codon:yes stop_codon:yes gene_type:complete
MSDFSPIEDSYLKKIFEVHYSTPEAIVKTTQLSQLMGVSAASVTEMIQRLSDREMVTHVPYRGCRLTPAGFQRAASVKRRECLLQILLSEVIGYNGDLSGVASKMGYSVDEELELALDKMLGFPKNDLNGEKIPGVKRSIETFGIGDLLPISSLPDMSTSLVELILLPDMDIITLREVGVSIGSQISRLEEKLVCEKNNLSLSPAISMCVIVRIISIGDDYE